MTSRICTNANCIFYAVANLTIFILGVAGNGLVIWIAGFKVKNSVVSTWYLSLVVSDFMFCSILPLLVILDIKNEWIFGLFMCKIRYFILLLNWFCSIFLLVIISVDRCVVIIFPVWAQNKRTTEGYENLDSVHVNISSTFVVNVWTFLFSRCVRGM
ncbi:hypothetical protein AOLI_G00276170 [Acnodon oligacanthus]